jgi:Tfp pilus assembly protein PilF
MHKYTTKIVLTVGILSTLAWIISGCASTPQKKELSHQERARLLLQVANGALLEGDPTGALRTLLDAEKEDPDMTEIHHSEALAYFAKNNLPEALKEAQIAVKLAPDYPDANNTLGKILVDSGRFNEAVAPLTKAAENSLYRDSYKAWTNLGILYYRKGDVAKAGNYFQKAIDNSRDEACIAYYYRGHLSLREGNYAEAIRDYQTATKRVCGGFADAHLAIAITYERTKQYDLARRGFLAIEQRFPNTKAADQAMNYLKNLP